MKFPGKPKVSVSPTPPVWKGSSGSVNEVANQLDIADGPMSRRIGRSMPVSSVIATTKNTPSAATSTGPRA
jgi:hypothetical protein